MQGGFERGLGQVFFQFAQCVLCRFAKNARSGRPDEWWGRDLHLDLNSSNLASPCLEKGNQLGGHLAQLVRNRAIVCSDDHHLLAQL